MITRTTITLAAVAVVTSLGALAHSGLARAEPQPMTARSAASTVPTWAYLCFEGRTAAEVMTKANEAGARGWELTTAAPGERGPIWCFRQPRWSRPEPD